MCLYNMKIWKWKYQNCQKPFLKFPFQWSSQKELGEFWNFEFSIFNDFFNKISNSLFTLLRNSIIWRMSDHRVQRSEIWDSRVVVQHIWGTFGLAAFKVIYGSSRHLRFSKNTISIKTLLLLKFAVKIFQLYLGFFKFGKLNFNEFFRNVKFSTVPCWGNL